MERWATVQANDGVVSPVLHAVHCQAEICICMQRSGAQNSGGSGEIGFGMGLQLPCLRKCC